MNKRKGCFAKTKAIIVFSSFLFLQSTVSNAYDYNPYSGAYLNGVDCAGAVIATKSIECSNWLDRAIGTIKYNSQGDRIWRSSYSQERPERDSVDAPIAMAISPTGEVIVAGHSNGEESANSDGYMERDFVTVKYDPYGNQLWVARYNGPKRSTDWEAVDHLRFVGLDDTGNIYVTGETCIPSEDWDYCCNIATIKYNPDGEELWVSIYDSCVDRPDGIVINGFAVDGDGNSFVLADTRESYSEHVVVMHDTYGNKLWEHPEEMDWDDISVDPEGNYYLVGSYQTPYDDDIGYLALNKYNSQREEIWSAKTQTTKRPSDGIIRFDKDDNIYVGTSTWNENMVVVKYDSDGQELWMKITEDTSLENMAVDFEGNVVVTGEVREGEVAYVMIKYDKEGTLLWTVLYYKLIISGLDLDFYPGDPVFDDSGNIYVAGIMSTSEGSYYASAMYDIDGNEKWISEYESKCRENEVFIEYDHPCYHGEDDDTDDTDDDQEVKENDDGDTCGCGCS